MLEHIRKGDYVCAIADVLDGKFILYQVEEDPDDSNTILDNNQLRLMQLNNLITIEEALERLIDYYDIKAEQALRQVNTVSTMLAELNTSRDMFINKYKPKRKMKW